MNSSQFYAPPSRPTGSAQPAQVAQVAQGQMPTLHPGAADGYMPVATAPYMQWQGTTMKPSPMMAPIPWGSYSHPQIMQPQPAAHPYGLSGLSIPRTRGEREDASGRWVLEPEDVLLLERVFALEKCPGRELRTQLAARLHVKPRQIQVWFQNKRQRTKNGAKPTVAEALAHAVYNSEHRTQSEPAELLMNMANAPNAAAPDAAAEGDGAEVTPKEGVAPGAAVDTILTMAAAPGREDVTRTDTPDAAPTAGADADDPVDDEDEEDDDDSNLDGHDVADDMDAAPGSAFPGAASDSLPAESKAATSMPPPADAADATRQALALVAGHTKGSTHTKGLAAGLPQPSPALPSVASGAAAASTALPFAGLANGAAVAAIGQELAAACTVPGLGAPAAPSVSKGELESYAHPPGQPHGFPPTTSGAAMHVSVPGTLDASGVRGSYPDGFTDGRMLWVRTDLLVMHPELLGVDATPIFQNGATQPVPVNLTSGTGTGGSSMGSMAMSGGGMPPAGYTSVVASSSGMVVPSASMLPLSALNPAVIAGGMPRGPVSAEQLGAANGAVAHSGVSLVRSHTADGASAMLALSGGMTQHMRTPLAAPKQPHPTLAQADASASAAMAAATRPVPTAASGRRQLWQPLRRQRPRLLPRQHTRLAKVYL